MAEESNTFVRSLAQYCAAHVLEEKLLLAPNHRVGWQWVDAAAMSGTPIANLRVRTIYGLARDLAKDTASGRTLLPAAGGPLAIQLAWSKLPENGYLTSLDPGRTLFQEAYKTIRSLRLAGLRPEDLAESAFEVGRKGAELRMLLSAYLEVLRDAGYCDHADLLYSAISTIAKGAQRTLRILLPAGLKSSLRGLERRLIEALPAETVHVLEAERTGEDGGDYTDLQLLRLLRDISEAPAGRGDGTVRFFHAMGEEGEAREAVRRAYAEGYLDQTEILYTTSEPYLPLLIECFWRMKAPDVHELPATFFEGIPCHYTRPGRALEAWVSWVRDGYPQRTITAMLREGLLRLHGDRSSWGAARAFETAPILRGLERYRPQLDKMRRTPAARPDFQDGDEEADRRRVRGWTAEDLEAAWQAVERVLDVTPPVNAEPDRVLEGAKRFLDEACNCSAELDNYAREKLVNDIAGLQSLLQALAPSSKVLDPWAWLAELTATSRIKGEGPRPGRAYCAPLRHGGHSMRPHTIVIGLDETKFPGAGRQDPLLLDGEKERLSAELPTSLSTSREAVERFFDLVGQLRGRVTFGYCGMSIEDRREMFPSFLFLDAYRLVLGPRDAEMKEVVRRLGPRVGFAPQEQSLCLHAAEWWMWRCCTPSVPPNATKALHSTYPNIADGLRCRQSREGSQFTEFDGSIPEHPPELDPLSEVGPILSAGALETLATCPLRYFFRHILRVVPPEAEPDPDEWLDALRFGSLMHEVFARFLRECILSGLPDPQTARSRLHAHLDECILRVIEEWPPPSAASVAEQRARMEAVCEAFLQEELSSDSQPVFVEVSVGIGGHDVGSEIDRLEPAEMQLGGKTLRLVGRIDRIDRAPGGYALIDYKTGSAQQFRDRKRYDQGRILQPVLYLHLARQVLGEYPVSFSYLFPSGRGEDVRYVWPVEELQRFEGKIAELCRLAALGAFPATDSEEDCKYCDYRRVCGDYQAVCANAKTKLLDARNIALEPFRRLRGIDARSA